MDKSRVTSALASHYTKDLFFRYVNTYDYCFRTHTKQRWLGRSVMDIFASEFKAFTESYYVSLLLLTAEESDREGTNIGQWVPCTRKLHPPVDIRNPRNSDLIEHYTIRRELPVYNLPISKVFEDDEVICYDKPPSIPVHPCGAYNKNSVTKILEFEEGLKNVHRIDKS